MGLLSLAFSSRCSFDLQVRSDTRRPRGPQPGLSMSSWRSGTDMEEERELDRDELDV